MKIGELKELIDQVDDSLEVRFAAQPKWPFEYSIYDAVIIETKDNPDGCLYLIEGSQIGYLPGDVCEEIGW